MKHLRLLFTVFSISLLLSACEPSKVTPSVASGGQYAPFIKAQIDAADFTAKYYRALRLPDGSVSITALAEDGRTLRLRIDSLKSFDKEFKQNGQLRGLYGRYTNTINFSSAEAATPYVGNIRLNVSANGRLISGTFNFEARNPDTQQSTYVKNGVLSSVMVQDSIPLDPTAASLAPKAGVNALINGLKFDPQQSVAVSTNNLVQISAIRDNGDRVIYLDIPASADYGSYQADNVSVNGFKLVYFQSGATYTTTNGVITVLEHDPYKRVLKGTFRFKAVDVSGNFQPDLDIVNGSFETVYY